MASSVTTRNAAWIDGIAVSGAEMRAAVLGSVFANAGLVRGLRPVQIPTPAMKIRVPAGVCLVADGQNGYLPLELAAQTDLDITTSSPTLPRIDSLVAEWTDAGGSSVQRLRVLTGTAAASPSAPSLPPSDNLTAKTLRIANVAVAAAASTIVNANITLQTGVALLLGANRFPNVASDGGRPASPEIGEAYWRTDNKYIELWSGAVWRIFDPNPPVLIMGRDADQSISNVTETALLFNTEEMDSHGGHPGTGSSYTAPRDGVYLCTAQVPWTATTSAGRFECWFKVNGSVEYAGDCIEKTTLNNTYVSNPSRLIRLTAGDTIEVWVHQNTGGARTTNSTYKGGVKFEILWKRPLVT